jgi:hypothetical protein
MTDVQKYCYAEEASFFSPLLQVVPSHCNPQAIKVSNVHLFVYSTSLWNKFLVDKTLSNACL